MKNLLLILVTVVISTTCLNSQNIFGMTRQQLEKGSQNQPECKNIKYNLETDGTGILDMTIKKEASIYKYTGLTNIIFYLDKDNVCFRYGHVYEIAYINEQIKELDKNYVKADDLKWINYKDDTEIILVKNDALFMLLYSTKKL